MRRTRFVPTHVHKSHGNRTEKRFIQCIAIPKLNLRKGDHSRLREIRRKLRFFHVDIRQREKRHVWKKVRFEPIAVQITKMPAVEGHSNSSYVEMDGERLLMEIRSVEKDKVMGVLWKTAIDGLPVQERGGQFIPLGIAADGGVSEPCVFGLFKNSYLAYTISQKGPYAALFSVYISRLFDKRFKIDLTPAKRPSFDKILPKITAFTGLNIRPRFSSMGRIPRSVPRTSLIGILKSLMSKSGKPVEIKFLGGRHTTSDDAFEEEFAEFLREHLKNPDNYSNFDILKGTALLQSGEIRSIDIQNQYLIEKVVKLRQDSDRCLDIAYAMRQISTVYIGKKTELEASKPN